MHTTFHPRLQSMQQWGNARGNQQWEYNLPEGFRRPLHSDSEMETFIRAKYERKKVSSLTEHPPAALTFHVVVSTRPAFGQPRTLP